MSYPQQEGYGQFSHGFYDSGFTMEGEGEGGAPQARQQVPAPDWQQDYSYTPMQEQQGTNQWMAGEREYQSYSGGQGGYAQQGYMDPSAAVGLPHEGRMDTEPAPGSLGHMDAPQAYSQGNGGYGTADFEDEPPLLEELGINFNLIKEKTLSVLNPLQQTRPEIMNDTDLAGPLMYCLLFGLVLLLSGKVHFDYIYGVGLIGCSAMYVVLSLMSAVGVSVSCVVSVLGYCLLPMVLLSCFSLIVSLQGVIGSVLSLAVIVWCSYSASKLFVSVLSMDHQQLLVAYPCALLYGVFALLTVF